MLLILTAAIRPAVYNREVNLMTQENGSRLIALETAWRDETRSVMLAAVGIPAEETEFYDLMVRQSKSLDLREIDAQDVQNAKNLAARIFSDSLAPYLSEVEWP